MGNRPAYRHAAETVGRVLAERGIGLVYGGGKVGLMGTVADACLAAGGEVIGVIPQSLVERELAHPGATEMRVVGSLHERKALMADLSDAFITLPGGMGTWEEVCEVLSWAQLGLHRKPCGLINVDGFYNFPDRHVRSRRGGRIFVAAKPCAGVGRTRAAPAAGAARNHAHATC